MDSITPEHRSWNMAQVRGKDTQPELKVRSWLFKNGYRYRKNDKRLTGKPDVVMPKYRTVIFVHGCFWHRHPGCKNTRTPKSNIEFWETKFSRNVENDKRHVRELEDLGWRVITIWECELGNKTFEDTMRRVEREILA